MSKTSNLEKLNGIRAVFTEENAVLDQFIQCIKENSFKEFPDVDSFVRTFGGVYGFSELFQIYLDNEVQMLLYPKKNKQTTEQLRGSIATDTIPKELPGADVADKAGAAAATLDETPTPATETEMMLRVLGSTMHVKPKKVKKRLAPTAVPVPPTPPMATATATATGPDSSNHAVNSGTLFPAPAALDSIGVAVPINKDLPHDILWRKSSSGDEPMKPPGLDINTAQLSSPSAGRKPAAPENATPPAVPRIIVDSNMTVTKVNPHAANTPFTGSEEENKDILSVAEVTAIVNMSAVYASLVVRLYIPFAVGIPFLTKLLGSTVSLVYQTGGTPSPSVFRTIIHVHVFAAKAIEFSLPLFGHLGPELAMELASSPAMQSYCPDAALLLRSLADESFSESETAAPHHATGLRKAVNDVDVREKDSFIRPFHADIDDRNLYKTKHDASIFNERESLYDEISEVYRKYQDAVSRDLDGSKVEEFWRYMSKACTKIIGGMRDCNFSWFADLVMRMLLHYGTNMPTDGPSVGPSQSQNPGSSSTSESGSSSKDKSFASAVQAATSSSSSSKHRLLEARMGPGGIGQSTSISRGPNRVIRPSSSATSSNPTRNVQNNTGPSQNSGNFKPQSHTPGQGNPVINYSTLLSQPAILFPGNQQFFFRFLIQCDSYRLSQCLRMSMWAELDNIIDTALHSFFGSDSFCACVNKLSLLGRFLGLLHFWPHWVLSVPKETLESGPLRNLMESTAENRTNPLAAGGLGAVNLLDIVQSSIREKRFCLTVPWVTEFLKLMSWDGTIAFVNGTARKTPVHRPVAVVNQELACVQYLVTLLFSDRKVLESETMSSNRVYILYVLEGFVGSLPNNLRHIDRKSTSEMKATGGLIGGAFSMSLRNTGGPSAHHILDLDDKSWAFSKLLFNETSAPFVVRALRYLRYPRGTVLSRSRSASSVSLPTPTMPPPLISGSLRITSTSISASNIVSSTPIKVHGNSVGDSEAAKPYPTPLDSPQMSVSESPRNLDMASLSNVSRTLFCSSPQGNASKARGLAAFNDFRTSSVDVKKAPEPLSFIAPVTASPTDILVCQSEGVLGRPTSPPGTSDTLAAAQNEDVPDRMIGYSPATLADAINSVNIGGGYGACPPTPTSSTPQPTLVLTPSLSRQLSSNTKSVGFAGWNDSKGVSRRLQQRLEVSFWRQHDNLFQISRYFLDQFGAGLKLQLKEMCVADAIHSAWNVSEKQKHAVMELFKQEITEPSVHPDRPIKSVVAELKVLFKHKLQSELRRVHIHSLKGAARHTESVTVHFFASAFPQLMRLYPSNENVAELALQLIRGQAGAETSQLLAYMDTYSMRKLDDVLRVSCVQFNSIIDKKSVRVHPLVRSIKSSDVGAHDISDDLGLRGASLKAGDNNVLDRRKEVFSSTMNEIVEFLHYSSVPDSKNQVAATLSWEVFSASTFTFALRPDTVDAMMTSNVVLSKERNRVGRFCELVSDLISAACEVLVFECGFSDSFLKYIRQAVRCENVRGDTVDSDSNSLVVLQRHFIEDSRQMSNRTVRSINWEIDSFLDGLDRKVWCVAHNVLSASAALLDSLNMISTKIRINVSDTAEILGVLHVEVMKMCSLTAPTLFYLDSLLFCGVKGCSNEWKSQTMWPSSLLFTVIDLKYVDAVAIGRSVLGSCKPSQVAYHESWKNYVSIKTVLEPFALFFFYRLAIVHRTVSGYDMWSSDEASVEAGQCEDINVPLGDIAVCFEQGFVEIVLKVFPPSSNSEKSN